MAHRMYLKMLPHMQDMELMLQAEQAVRDGVQEGGEVTTQQLIEALMRKCIRAQREVAACGCSPLLPLAKRSSHKT